MTRNQIISILRKEVRTLIKENKIVVSRKKFKSASGRTWAEGNKDIIKIPSLTTIENAYTALHEIAHVIKKHYNDDVKKEYIKEYEAEKWAINKLKELEVDIYFPKDYKSIEKNAKRYVYSYMIEEKTKIQERVKKWIMKF